MQDQVTVGRGEKDAQVAEFATFRDSSGLGFFAKFSEICEISAPSTVVPAIPHCWLLCVRKGMLCTGVVARPFDPVARCGERGRGGGGTGCAGVWSGDTSSLGMHPLSVLACVPRTRCAEASACLKTDTEGKHTRSASAGTTYTCWRLCRLLANCACGSAACGLNRGRGCAAYPGPVNTCAAGVMPGGDYTRTTHLTAPLRLPFFGQKGGQYGL